MKDTFDDLFVEKDELNEEILKEILVGRIKMTSEGDIIFQKDFEPKTAILIYLLANKVFLTRKIREAETAGPKEIHHKTGVAEGTVKKYVRDMQKDRLLIGKNGKYFVPNHALSKVKKLVNEND
ncbi:MAG: hypothetical protein KKF65_00780 [Nanoarchaeota archaeon]|nr:hypothetical protein [Nanoarchaeota archaeon]